MSEAADVSCCQNIASRVMSRFEVVQLGWYDGVTEGLARCKVCKQTYAFDVLCSSKAGPRVCGFARIAPAHYEAVAAAVEATDSTEEVEAWRERVALVATRIPRHQHERDVFVLADSIEEEVIASRKVDFASLQALLVHADVSTK